MTRQSRSAAGFSVAELLAVVAVGAVLMVVSTPTLASARRGLAVRGVARTVAASFREAAALARARQRAVGWEVRSTPLAIRLVEDGDGDGLRRDDVDDGTDAAVGGWRAMGAGALRVAAVVGCDCPDVDGMGTLAAGDRGMRFGTSSFVSFSARGTASAGTLYLATAGGPSVAVRVFGATGRIRTFEFLDGGDTWVER